MNLKALITALVLAGTSTAALADSPSPSAQVVRDHRDHDFHRRPSWLVIASQSQLSRGRDVITTNQRIAKIQLVAVKGATTIDTITIKFANGGSQRVRLNQTLAPNAAPLTIALDGGLRNVTRIVVTGNSSRRASFEVLGA